MFDSLFLQEGKDAGTAIVYVIEQLESVFLLNLEVNCSELVSPTEVLHGWKCIAADFWSYSRTDRISFPGSCSYRNNIQIFPTEHSRYVICRHPHTSALRFHIMRKAGFSRLVPVDLWQVYEDFVLKLSLIYRSWLTSSYGSGCCFVFTRLCALRLDFRKNTWNMLAVLVRRWSRSCGLRNYADKIFGMVLQELRRKLPVTRTLFAWDKALQLSLTREITREFSNMR